MSVDVCRHMHVGARGCPCVCYMSCMDVCVCMCMSICMCMYMGVCMCAYVPICMWVIYIRRPSVGDVCYVYVCMKRRIAHRHGFMCMYRGLCARMYVCISMCMYMQVHVHVCGWGRCMCMYVRTWVC